MGSAGAETGAGIFEGRGTEGTKGRFKGGSEEEEGFSRGRVEGVCCGSTKVGCAEEVSARLTKEGEAERSGNGCRPCGRGALASGRGGLETRGIEVAGWAAG